MDAQLFCIAGLGLLLLIVIGGAISTIRAQDRRKEQIVHARSEYERGLSLLRADPDNQELRQATLQAGRVYVEVAAKADVFSETVLMNDLNAIPATGRNSGPQTIPTKSAKERLEELSDLYSDGLISKEEFETRRSVILGEV